MSDILYTLHKGWFYEPPGTYTPADDTLISRLRHLLPKWTFENYGIWLIVSPPDAPLLPKAGFKIHVSTRFDNRERILTVCAETLGIFPTFFKCLTDWEIWTRLHDKPYAGEHLFEYGKCIVIYPDTKEQALDIASHLAEELKTESGPDILTDTPFGASKTVFYRYSRYAPPEDAADEMDDTAEDLALTANELIPPPSPQDLKTNTPAAPHPLDKYQIIEAIETSAAGGVYLATHQNRKYILKEANEDACVSNGSDAIDRLRSELSILQKLADLNLNISPRPIEQFRGYWRNHFGVLEFLPGETLTEALRESVSIETRLDIARRLAEAVTTLHQDAIICWGDVSPTNVLYDKTSKEIYLLDFEHASLSENGQAMHATTDAGTPGFRSTSENRALAHLLFSVFLPVNAAFITPQRFLKALQGRLPKQLIEVLDNALEDDISAKEIAKSLRTVNVAAADRPIPDTSQEQISSHRYTQKLESILNFIKTHLTFQRKDRLFPCAPDGFVFPLSIASGATGLAEILRSIGGDENRRLAARALDWVFAHTDFKDAQKLAATPGFYDGTAGIATVAGAFGEKQSARKCLYIAAAQIQNTPRFDVYNGIAGVADAALQCFKATDEEFYLNTAQSLVDALISKAADTNDPTRLCNGSILENGYLFGRAGIATVLLKIAEHLQAQRYADIGTQTLLWLEKQLIRAEDGGLTIPIMSGSDTCARNFADGTAGVAKAFIHARTCFGTEKDALIEQLLRLPYPVVSHTPRPGYFYGIAGVGTALLDAYESIGDTGYLREAEHLLAELFCFEVPDTEGIGYPGGDTLQRLACDVATGSLGIAHFLHRLLMAQQSVEQRSSGSK